PLEAAAVAAVQAVRAQEKGKLEKTPETSEDRALDSGAGAWPRREDRREARDAAGELQNEPAALQAAVGRQGRRAERGAPSAKHRAESFQAEKPAAAGRRGRRSTSVNAERLAHEHERLELAAAERLARLQARDAA